MYLPDIELHEATSLAEASALVTHYAPDARFLAGGTDLFVDLKAGRVRVKHAVSINRIDVLRGISADGSGLRIGALTTPNQLTEAQVVRDRFAAILDGAKDMAAPQVRNMATIGGNIASAIPSADLPPILMVMDASVVLWSSSGERTLPLASFFVGPRQTARKNEEVLTAIVVPNPPARFGAAYVRFALREANACAVAGVAASLRLADDDTVREARIVIGAVAPTPKLVESAAELLVGELPGQGVFVQAGQAAMEAAEPISDIRASADYRRDIVGVLTSRALAAAHQRAKEATN